MIETDGYVKCITAQPTGQTGDNDACIRERFQNSELRLETRGIPLALQLQELVQQSPAADPSTILPHQLRVIF